MTDDARATQIAQRLYAQSLAEFVAARNAASKAAKDAGDTDLAERIRKFRKPAAGAGLVNQLVRSEEPLLQEVRDLGPRLRTAQADADAAELRTLDRERRALVSRCVTAAGRLEQDGGRRATAASLRDVEQTIWAALVDAGASAAVLAGMLVRPLSPSGFGTVDIEGASAVPVEAGEADEPRRVTPSRTPRSSRATAPTAVPAAAPAPVAPSKGKSAADRQAIRTAQRDVDVAESRLSESVHARDDAAQAADDTREAIDRLDTELADLRDRTAAAKQAKQRATSRLPAERASLRAAERDRRTAASDLERARQRAKELRETP